MRIRRASSVYEHRINCFSKIQQDLCFFIGIVAQTARKMMNRENIPEGLRHTKKTSPANRDKCRNKQNNTVWQN
jgi:hypothetical protein